jgi:hypothetical protein
MTKKNKRYLEILAMVLLAVSCQLLAVSYGEACPLCAASTPFKHGLQWAVAFILPIPFILAGALVWWIRRNSFSESENPK